MEIDPDNSEDKTEPKRCLVEDSIVFFKEMEIDRLLAEDDNKD